MHELSICHSLLRQIDDLAVQHKARSVARFTLWIGPLSGVEPLALTQAFMSLRGESMAANAEMVIEERPVRVRCPQCGLENHNLTKDLACPLCGNRLLEMIGGDELHLAGISMVLSESMDMDSLQLFSPF